jgi:O-antigen/teichoic acid export membrane protein
VATLNMGGSLYFYVPRSDARMKKVYIHNTVVYFGAAGLLFALALGPWNPLLPASLEPLAKYGPLVPAILALWFATLLLDYLPAVEERIGWQAWASVSSTALRVLLIAAAAWFGGDLYWVLWAIVAAVLYKVALLLYYIHRRHGLGLPWFRRASFVEQFRYSLPFGVSSGLFALRGQLDQWVAASVFALSSFASFTIAALVGQVVHIFRHSVMEAFLPSMSRLDASGDVRGMLEMNARANSMVGMLLYPLLAFAFAFAEDIVTIIYTSAYAEAGPVMRVYIIGMAAMVIEVGSMVLLLRQGPFALRVTAVLLAVSAAVSWTAAHHIGLAGAALGSVLAIYLDRALILRRVASHTGIRLRKLQHWGSLARSLATAAIAAALAWACVHRFLPQAAPLLRLVAGATVLAGVYAALNFRAAGGR